MIVLEPPLRSTMPTNIELRFEDRFAVVGAMVVDVW